MLVYLIVSLKRLCALSQLSWLFAGGEQAAAADAACMQLQRRGKAKVLHSSLQLLGCESCAFQGPNEGRMKAEEGASTLPSASTAAPRSALCHQRAAMSRGAAAHHSRCSSKDDQRCLFQAAVLDNDRKI